MDKFKLVSKFKPKGSQPDAISKLVHGLEKKHRFQTLLGVTGSGKSLDFNEKIIIRDKEGKIIKTTIGYFVERHLKNPRSIADSLVDNVEGFKILSFDPDTYNFKEQDIVEVSRHQEEILYEIILDDNSSIRVTKDHNCFRFCDAKLELVPTKALKEGDFIPTSNILPQPKKGLSSINLIDSNKKLKLNIKELIEKFDPNSKNLALFFKREYPGPGRWKLKQILNTTKERGITYVEFKKVLKILGIELVKANKYVKFITKRQDKLTPLLKVTDKFLTFLGLYIAGGHNTGNYILISNPKKSLQKTCKSFFDSLNLDYHQRNKNDIAFHSKIFSNFLSCFGKKAEEKKIPEFVFNLDNSQLSVLIRSIFDCDGWVENNSVHLGSVSKELVFDLKDLLLRYGITSRVRIKKSMKPLYILNISGKNNIESFRREISFSLGYKKKKLMKISKSKDNTNVDLIPNSSHFFKSIRKRFKLYQIDVAKICKCNRSYISMVESGIRCPSIKLSNNLINWLSKKNPKYRHLKNLVKFNFRKIVKIKKTKSTMGYVYDLSVKNNENFVAGNGNIFVHNTFTMAQIINKVQRPALVLAHNKTLAAQLYNEFREFFPNNRVEYFVSYYDYYQPESYIPSKDQYIEKDSDINPKIEQLRLAATASLLSRRDTIVVASVSCIYSIGDPSSFKKMGFEISVGQKMNRSELISRLVEIQFERNDIELMPGRFRVKGDVVDFIPGYFNDIIRIEMFGDEIERISEIDKNTGDLKEKKKYFYIYPARHFVIDQDSMHKAVQSIRTELDETLPKLDMIESHRLKQRTLYDIEMLEETGYCKGIENYSRHFDGRKPGERPFCLVDFFPDDFLMFVDESHQMIPQLHGMYNGDRARKKALIDYGFRLPSAYDNRPLQFDEFEKLMKSVIFVSATPGDYERSHSKQIAEQIIRPTGLVDPKVEVRPIKGQIADILSEVDTVIKRGDRVLLTTLTKKLAEELTDFLASKKVKARYLHSEIDTLERSEIIRELRLGKFDVLVGINLLREGLDIPEVGFIGILDADKEGFLRDARSLIQIIGRAARNVRSKVVLYADNVTKSIRNALAETERRRKMQIRHNKKHRIVPRTIKKAIPEKEVEIKDVLHIPKKDVPGMIITLQEEMKQAADRLEFERAIALRDKIEKLKERAGE
jgi:excinuclease ABC subunit B